MTNLRYPYQFDGRGRTAESRRGRPHSRPDRAGAVHRAGRAGHAPGLRQRRDATGVRAEQRRTGGDHAIPGAGRLAAMAGRSDRRWKASKSRPKTRPCASRCATPSVAPEPAQVASVHPGRGLAMIYHCCEPLRRNAVAAHPTLNGIDYLEVLDNDSPESDLRQRTLLLRLLKPVPAGFGAGQARIEGGERVRNVAIEWVGAGIAAAGRGDRRRADLSRGPARGGSCAGDPHRPLRRSLDLHACAWCARRSTPRRRRASIRVLAEIQFSFKVECPSDFDCKPVVVCPDDPTPAPVIDYLAKDYASFRRLILDRDHATGARLARAQRRRSRRHAGRAARLRRRPALLPAGCRRHRGLSGHGAAAHFPAPPRPAGRLPLARWLQCARLAARAGGRRRPSSWTGRRPASALASPGCRRASCPASRDEELALRARPAIFEPLHDATLHAAHNQIHFHAWGDRRCCLPKGATSATLAGHLAALASRRRAAVRGSARSRDRRDRRCRSRPSPCPAADGGTRLLAGRSGAAADRPADRRRNHRDRLGRRRRAAFPALHFLGHRPGPRRGLPRPCQRRARQHGAGRSWPHHSRQREPGPRPVAPAGLSRRSGPRSLPGRASPRGAAALQPDAGERAADLCRHGRQDDEGGRCRHQPAAGVRSRGIGGGGARPGAWKTPCRRSSSTARWARSANRGRRGATCSAATPMRRTSSSKSSTTAARGCASATIGMGGGRRRTRRSPPAIGSAMAAPAMSARRPSPMSSRSIRTFWASGIRCRRRAAPTARMRPPCGGARRRPSGARSGPSRRRTTPRSPSGMPACSGPRPPCAGREAGTRCSSPSTGTAACRSMPPSRTRSRPMSIATAWPATIPNSTIRSMSRWK